MLSTRLLNSFRTKVSQAGFTMIELLVVISVIGVLSVAVLSAINPIEQINKGRDTRARTDAANIINAVDRYFSIAEEYPWNTATGTYTPASTDYRLPFTMDETGTATSTNPGTWDWADILATNSEVKSGFVDRLKGDAQVNYLLYKANGSNATMYSCFLPSSNAFKQQAQETCTTGSQGADFPATACPASCATDQDTCMICLP